MKKNYKDYVNQITGVDFSLTGLGISWKPSTLDIEIARELITLLEDKRALYNPYILENPRYVTLSIIDIGKELSSMIKRLEPNSKLINPLKAMRSCCRTFKDKTERLGKLLEDVPFGRIWDRSETDFFIALGELRSCIGIISSQIAIEFKLDVEEQLISIFPKNYKE